MQAISENKSDISDIRDRIKNIQVSKGLTNKGFSDVLGISPQSLHDIVAGKRSMPGSNVLIKIVSEISDINPAWLLTGKGEPFISSSKPEYEPPPDKLSIAKETLIALQSKKNTGKVFLLDEDVAAAAGAGIMNTDARDIYTYPSMDWDGLSKNKIHARIRVSGDSMQPTLYNGDYIIATRLDAGSYRSIKDDYIYIIVTQAGEVIIKRCLNRLKERQNLWIKSDNPSYLGYDLPADNIIDVWEAKIRISYNLSNTQSELYTRVSRLEEEFSIFKNSLP